MPRQTDDRRETTPALPEQSRAALATALLRHRIALATLAECVCDFARKLARTGVSRPEILAAVHEIMAELHVSTIEGDGYDESLDSMVVWCLDQSALATN